MKNFIRLSSVCLLVLFASTSSLAQKASASPPPQDERLVIWDPPCPTIVVSCPSDIEVGKRFEFKATIGNLNPNTVRTYKWEVIGGEIAEGKGTPAIRVEIGPVGSITATLRVGGLDAACSTTASCSTGIHRSFLRPEKIDSIDAYDFVEINKEKVRLDLFADALKQHPGSRGYILSYDGRRNRAGATHNAVNRARGYLIHIRSIDSRRIVTVDGGFKERLTLDLWLVPAGATPPSAEPTVDRSEVRLIKARRIRVRSAP